MARCGFRGGTDDVTPQLLGTFREFGQVQFRDWQRLAPSSRGQTNELVLARRPFCNIYSFSSTMMTCSLSPSSFLASNVLGRSATTSEGGPLKQMVSLWSSIL